MMTILKDIFEALSIIGADLQFSNDAITPWTIGIFLLLFLVLCTIIVGTIFQNAKHKKTSPPLAPWGMFETIRGMTSDQVPWFILKSAEICGTDTFRLSLPIPGAPMVVATRDSSLAREVLNDSLSWKPKTYQDFEPVGYGTIFTRNGSFWQSRRKCVASAFSVKHVKRMNQVAMDRIDHWIENKLIPWSKQGTPFNIAEEMISVTLEAICETAFEYQISDEEKHNFTCNCELIFKEYFTKSIINPFRKYLGNLLPERRRARQAAEANHAFALRIIQNYRKNPNPTKGTIIDLIANNSCYASDDEVAADVVVYLVGGHDVSVTCILQLFKHFLYLYDFNLPYSMLLS